MIKEVLRNLKTGNIPKTAIVSGTALAISFILLPVFIFPRVNTIFEVRSEINQNQKNLNVLTVKLAQLAEIDRVSSKNKLAKIAAVLPATKDIPGLMLDLERLTYIASVSMEAVQLSPGNINEEKSSGNEQTSVKFQLIIKGSLANIKEFLKKVSISGRLLGIENLRLSSSTTDNQTTVSLDMRAFYQPLPKSMGKIDEPLPVISAEENQAYQKISASGAYGRESGE